MYKQKQANKQYYKQNFYYTQKSHFHNKKIIAKRCPS